VTDAPPDYVNGQLRGIVGVELTVATDEAKHKLSQNRGADDRASVAEVLRHEPGPDAAEISALMSAAAAGLHRRGDRPGHRDPRRRAHLPR
jgi:transcriptional regulator